MEEVLSDALAKALELVSLALAHRDRIVSNELNLGIGAVRRYLTEFESIPLRDYAVPAELKRLIEPIDQALLLSWLSQLFPDFAHISTALPITILDNMASCTQSNREQFLWELLRLCFPAVLLCIELSQEPEEEKERLAQDWFMSHKSTFWSYLRKTAFETEKIVGIFTKDQSDIQFGVDAGHILEKASALGSVAQLRSSLETFLQTSSQQLYVLDYSLAVPQSVDLSSAKALLEDVLTRSDRIHKLLCLLVRLPAIFLPLQGPWSHRWKLVAFESLSEPFNNSVISMWKWLKHDTRNSILQEEFIGSREKVELFCRRYMATQQQTIGKR